MVTGAASVVCRCSALVVAAALVGWRGTAFLLMFTILIAIHIASSNSVSRELAIFVLGLAVLADPVVGIDVGGRRNKITSSDESHAGVVELPLAALTEPHVGSLWGPAQATLVTVDVLSLWGGDIGSF